MGVSDQVGKLSEEEITVRKEGPVHGLDELEFDANVVTLPLVLPSVAAAQFWSDTIPVS
jgi:hypothetical protein